MNAILVVIGAASIVFGVVGLVGAREIVAKQGEVGVKMYDDTPVDEETEIEIARLIGVVFLVIGTAVAAYGLGVF